MPHGRMVTVPPARYKDVSSPYIRSFMLSPARDRRVTKAQSLSDRQHFFFPKGLAVPSFRVLIRVWDACVLVCICIAWARRGGLRVV
jgi:hypothetical protein